MASSEPGITRRAKARDGVAGAGDVNCADFVGRDQHVTYGFTAAEVERLIEKVLAFLEAGATFVPAGDRLRAEVGGDVLAFYPGAPHRLARRRNERSYLLSLAVRRDYQVSRQLPNAGQ